MRGRLAIFVAVVLLHSACGGSDFEDTESTGGAAGSGGSGGTPASGGTGGVAGADSSVGGTGGSSGSSGAGGSSGAAGSGDGSAGAPSGGGTSGDSGVDSSVDAATDSGGDADGGGGPPIAVVQITPTALSTAAVPTLTLQATPVAGNSIIVGITCISDHLGDCIIGTSGVTDNQGNSYTRALQGESIKSSAQGARGYIFIAQNIGATSGSFVISVDPDGTTAGQSLAWGAIEVSGLAAPPSLDASDIGLASGGGTCDAQCTVSTTVTSDTPTTQANELAIGVLSVRSNDTNILIAPESTWTSHHVHQNNASGPPGHSMISKILNTTGTVSHTWTHHLPTRGAAGILATFKGVTPN